MLMRMWLLIDIDSNTVSTQFFFWLFLLLSLFLRFHHRLVYHWPQFYTILNWSRWRSFLHLPSPYRTNLIYDFVGASKNTIKWDISFTFEYSLEQVVNGFGTRILRKSKVAKGDESHELNLVQKNFIFFFFLFFQNDIQQLLSRTLHRLFSLITVIHWMIYDIHLKNLR